MKHTTIISVAVWMFFIVIPSCLPADDDENQIFGVYQTIAESRKTIILDIKPDRSATIDKTDQTIGTGNVVVRYTATWSLNGGHIEIQYNGITEILRFYERLSFEEFGIHLGIPGLKAPPGVQNPGIIGSTSLWKSEALQNVSRFQFKLKGVQISTSDYDMPILYILSPGLFFLCLGLILIIKRLMFLRHAHSVLGIVVSYSERFPIADQTVLAQYLPKVRFPKVRFTTENGTSYEFVDNSFRGWLASEVGSKIPVVYHSRNPENALIKHIVRLWGIPILISAFGMFLIYVFY